MNNIGGEITVTTEIEVDGVLTDPVDVAIEVTAPDGTTTEPVVSHPSTGIYEGQFEPNAAGRWRWKWTTTTPDGVEFGHADVQLDPPPPGRLDPLASISDLEDRLGRDLTDSEARRAAVLLGDASALVRNFTRQNFDLVRDDVVLLRPVGTTLRLPQRPVLAVSGVVAVGCDGLQDFALPGFCWDGADLIDIDGINTDVWVSLPAWWDDFWGGANTYRVTYDHGYPTTPDDVVGIVCGMVNRILVAPSMVEGMLSERVGPFGYTLQQGSSGAPGPQVRLTQADRDALADAGYRRTADTIQLRT